VEGRRTFYPFALTSKTCPRESLELKLESRRTRPSSTGPSTWWDAVATHDQDSGDTAIFLVNRSLDLSPSTSSWISQPPGIDVNRKRREPVRRRHARGEHDCLSRAVSLRGRTRPLG
jgi:hypothetical protein